MCMVILFCIYVHIYMHMAHRCVCVCLHVHAVPIEARRGHLTPLELAGVIDCCELLCGLGYLNIEFRKGP